MARREGTQAIILKVHYMINGHQRVLYALNRRPGNDGFFIIEEPHEDTLVERGYRLIKVQNQATRGLNYDQVIEKHVPNIFTGEIMFHIAMGDAPIPNRVSFLMKYFSKLYVKS